MSVANHRCAFRPVHGGTLIYQPLSGEAGTLGMIVTADGADRWLLTCYHVLARRDFTLVADDPILQPDAANGPIALLHEVRADRALDCAVARVTVTAHDAVLGIGNLTAVRPPCPGMRVIKSGWKTGVTEGRIQKVSGSDVIIERLPGFPGDYVLATGGDSGAIWVDAATLAPVALHTSESAVGPHLAMATALDAVLTRLGVRQL